MCQVYFILFLAIIFQHCLCGPCTGNSLESTCGPYNSFIRLSIIPPMKVPCAFLHSHFLCPKVKHLQAALITFTFIIQQNVDGMHCHSKRDDKSWTKPHRGKGSKRGQKQRKQKQISKLKRFLQEPKLPSCRDHSFWHQRIHRVWFMLFALIFLMFLFQAALQSTYQKGCKRKVWKFEITNACIPAKSLQIFANLQMLVHSDSFWLASHWSSVHCGRNFRKLHGSGSSNRGPRTALSSRHLNLRVSPCFSRSNVTNVVFGSINVAYGMLVGSLAVFANKNSFQVEFHLHHRNFVILVWCFASASRLYEPFYAVLHSWCYVTVFNRTCVPYVVLLGVFFCPIMCPKDPWRNLNPNKCDLRSVAS